MCCSLLTRSASITRSALAALQPRRAANRREPHEPRARGAAFAVALVLGGSTAIVAAAAPPAPALDRPPAPDRPPVPAPAGVGEDLTLFELVPGTVYLNGGVGKLQAQRMRQDASNWPLRLSFSDRSNNEFVAGVRLMVFDHRGHAVLRLTDAGPMTFVQLPSGDYRITASYRGQQLSRSVHVGPKGLDANFHWLL